MEGLWTEVSPADAFATAQAADPSITAWLDSLDTITIRNKFNKEWKAAAPIEIFVPNQTLADLVERLEQLLGAGR